MRDYTTLPNVFRVASSQSNSLHNNNNNQHNSHEGNQTTLTAVTTQAIVHGESMLDAGSESVPIRINYPHKLTTAASIERHYQQAADLSGDRRQATAYATLPRSLSPVVNGDLRVHLRGRALATDERIINTISGSIPSTGFTTITTASLERSGSLGSDLNNSLNDFSQLNSLEPHHLQQQQQQQRDFRLLRADTTDYQHFQTRRLAAKQFTALERGSDNSYLWILTPVAAR